MTPKTPSKAIGMPGTEHARPPVFSVALVSVGALAYEVLLMRLFSIIQWHHFAYMVISLALLGYGVSGTFLALTQHRLLSRFTGAYVANALLFAAAVLGCYAAAQRIAFNPGELLWDPKEWLQLAGVYLVLALPFFFAANCIALALMRYRRDTSRVYAADLAGAGLGSALVVLVLFVVFPHNALRIIAMVGVCAAAVAWWELRPRIRVIALLWVALGAAAFAAPEQWIRPLLSPYKGLSQTLQVAGTEVVEQRSSPLGLLSAVTSPQVPLRHAPGLSLNARTGPPPQVGVFSDGGSMTVINRFTGERAELSYLDQLTSALPYHMHQPESVLVLGAGGGSDVLQALYHGAGAIDAVELNPQMVQLVQETFADFAGNVYGSGPVKVHVAEARGFASATSQRFDLIQIGLANTPGAASAGVYALNETYLYTVEALGIYLERLRPGGYLAISGWVQLPPRDNLKLLMTVAEALRRAGVEHPEQHLAMIRSWQTGTLVVKNGPFSETETEALRRFCEQRGFDPAFYPGMPRSQANRNNVLPKPYFYEAAQAIGAGRAQQYIDNYKFNLEPPTDDQPYFFRFFKWSTLPELLALRGRGGTALLESGYLVLVATLAQAVAASVLLILVPLVFRTRQTQPGTPRASRPRVLAYFLALGLGFLFVEIAFIQKFILFLHHPIYSAAVVLSAFLVFAGLGSAWSTRYAQGARERNGAIYAVTAVIGLSLAYASALGPVFAALSALPVPLKALCSVALVAPVAFFMGVPFPLGLSALGRLEQGLVPWAWAVNGCASVVSAVLATLTAIHFGFGIVVIAAGLFYIMAAFSFPARIRTPGTESRR